ncbi:hypothetical protein BT69DRAFT_1295670 [Atractiella rhizophila]|nr:hypothetical protein BT69DRAFT_1295670 [Atractiella rhizophila]
MSRNNDSFADRIQMATRRDLFLNPYVQELESKLAEVETALEREQTDKDKWKKFYMEKDEEVNRLKLQLEKVRKAPLPAKATYSVSKDRIEGMMTTEFTDPIAEVSEEDWIRKPVKAYRPIIGQDDADKLGIFWERKQAAAATRTGVQNNILDPVRVLHQLIFDETDNTVIGATQLSQATADVIRNNASLYAKTYLNTTKSIKNQTGICKTTYLPNILRKLELDYSTVLCIGKTDWMSRIFVTLVLRNTCGSIYDDDDDDGEEVAAKGSQMVKRGVKRKSDSEGPVILSEKRIRIDDVCEDHSEADDVSEAGRSIGIAGTTVLASKPKKKYRAISDLPQDPHRGKTMIQGKNHLHKQSATAPDSIVASIDLLKAMGVDDDTAINLNILATFVETGMLPLSQATSETLTESATKHLLVAVNSAESDFHLPIDADDEQYTSEDLQNSPRGDTLGHNSLGEEILFRLKRWENVGSRKAILELLHAVLRGAMVSKRLCKRWKDAHPNSTEVTPLLLNFGCIGRLAESLVETWLDGGGSNAVDAGKDLRLAKDLKDTIVQGEYSIALQEKMMYRKTFTTPNKVTNEKNPRIEQHQIKKKKGGGSNAVDAGKDLRLAKDLKNTIAQGEYSIALQEKMMYRKTFATPNKVTNEKNPRIEQHQISPLHPPPDDNGFHPPQPSSSATLPAIEHTLSSINHEFSPPQSADHAPPPVDCSFPPINPVSPYIDHSFPPPTDPSLLLPKQTHSDPQPHWGGQAKGVGMSKKKRGRSKKNVEETGGLPQEEILKLHEDVEQLRPLLDMNTTAQLVEAKKLAKDNNWKAYHWKKMLQYQVINKEVIITKFNSIDKRTLELLRLLKMDQGNRSLLPEVANEGCSALAVP